MIARFAAMSEEERVLRFSAVERLAMLSPWKRKIALRGFSIAERELLIDTWFGQARDAQQPPPGDWRIWLMMAGRGFGKTRAGAEWVLGLAAAPGLRIALAGPTEEEARRVMIEGSSGLLACAPEEARPEWEPARGRLTWPSGSQAFVYSGANPEALRGPEHDYAWCDELAKWAYAEAAWTNLMLGLRRGDHPRVLATTTPRPTPLMRRLAGSAEVVKSQGRTADNVMLASGVTAYVTDLYGGTRLGRQELEGELIEDVEGTLWSRELIERCRVASPLHRPSDGPPPRPGEELRRVVIGDGVGYVLGDHSVRGLSPEGWARAVAAAAEAHGADCVVAETNQGGEMVASVLRSADSALPVKPAHARFGKGQRAEPVAMLFECGKAKFAGGFPELEDELAGMTAAGGYQGPGRSPDRADAMVWALTELMLGKPRPQPRVRFL